VIPQLVHADSVVYGFGVGDDVSWDLAMIDRFGVVVHAFDPTPRSVRWVERADLRTEFVFHRLGIADYDGEATFVMRHPDPDWTSYSLERDPPTEYEVATAEVRRLATIASELGHQRLDVVKLDVEGAEYGVIGDMVGGTLIPTQLLVEFHYAAEGREGLRRTRETLAALRRVGYRIFWRSPNGYEFGFVLLA
jgi:FkbM family methyltransferase